MKEAAAKQTTFFTAYDEILQCIQAIDPVKYAATRNFTNGAVTKLSPYISRGVISGRQVLQAVLQKGYTHHQIIKLIQELAWREYFQRVWQHLGNDIWKDIKHPQQPVFHHQMIKSINEASTGIEAIDHHIRLLYETGYMHNHLRMYTASLACNIAKAHWHQPSKWMYYHLLDGDIASNTCSWQWVAGSFASKKYYCNQENINRYTGFNQTNSFLDKPYEEIISMPVPEILDAAIELKLETILPPAQLPVLDTRKRTFIYNSYHLDPLWRKEEDANRILLLEPSHFKKYPVSEKVMAFIIGLAGNIPGMQVFVGEINDIVRLYNDDQTGRQMIVSKKHPAFLHYPGTKDAYDWIFDEVTGYYPSFSAYWKRCEKYLDGL